MLTNYIATSAAAAVASHTNPQAETVGSAMCNARASYEDIGEFDATKIESCFQGV